MEFDLSEGLNSRTERGTRFEPSSIGEDLRRSLEWGERIWSGLFRHSPCYNLDMTKEKQGKPGGPRPTVPTPEEPAMPRSILSDRWVVLFHRGTLFFQRGGLGALAVLATLAGALTGLVLVSFASLTSFAVEVDALADYRPPEITRVFASNGNLIGELSLERRIPIEYQAIPQTLRDAILAIEDTRFYDHLGLDPVRIAGSLVQNVIQQRRAQGASTLTQQLARVLFLRREKTYIRKIKEIMFALQIERVYTKEQILTMYCNQIFLGGGAYGFEAAANYYFGKPLRDLQLHQYALLAAIPKGPQVYSPLLRPKAALERRNLVLHSMAEAGYLSLADADAAKSRPLDLDPDDQRGRNDRSPHAYFLEEVRLELQRLLVEKHSQDAMDVYRAGLNVYTSLDEEAQIAAVKAVRWGAQQYQRRHGWRFRFENILSGLPRRDGTPIGTGKGRASANTLSPAEVATLDTYRHPSWSNAAPAIEEVTTGLIREVNERGAVVSFGRYRAEVTAEETRLAGRPPSTIFKRGDLAPFRIRAVNVETSKVEVTFEPQPDVQAALVLLDVRTGHIRALVGGYDFATTKFNHATQANRQTGSVFKPFIYAAALEKGMQPDDIVDDVPFQRGNWSPRNYDNTYLGPISLRQALALSRNIPAVRVLDEVGVKNAGDLVTRLKLPNPMAPFLPSALGATEEPLLNMVSAYAVFPNMGRWVEPTRIVRVVDRDGNLLEEAQPRAEQVLTPYVAGQMVDLMRGAVQFGTAASASSLGVELAGKTGTVNDFTDAWFIGYTPTVACGVWIGYSDQKRSLGQGEAGASAALPFWLEFMRTYLKGKEKERFPLPPSPSDEIREIQQVRASQYAAERARLGALSGDMLPDSVEIPDLDPLGAEPKPAIPPPATLPTPPRATPPPPSSASAGELSPRQAPARPPGSPSPSPALRPAPPIEGGQTRSRMVTRPDVPPQTTPTAPPAPSSIPLKGKKGKPEDP
jgi:penicillin-binding protein 1A